jgi:hypothetical protein
VKVTVRFCAVAMLKDSWVGAMPPATVTSCVSGELEQLLVAGMQSGGSGAGAVCAFTVRAARANAAANSIGSQSFIVISRFIQRRICRRAQSTR